MKPISFVVPALNEEDYLPILFQSFIEQDFAGEYEIIVVDGGSTDGTLKVVKDYQNQLPNLSFYTHDRGISKQRNFGASKARYDSIVFIDADMKLSKGALQKIERFYRTHTNFTGTPILYPYDGKLADIPLGITGYIQFIINMRTQPATPGMCILTTKEVHQRIGGFDEKAVVAEDVDYGLRAHKSGARHYILFNVIIWGSARRLDAMGRMKLAKTWADWYKHNVKYGPIYENTFSEYEFGKFKRK